MRLKQLSLKEKWFQLVKIRGIAKQILYFWRRKALLRPLTSKDGQSGSTDRIFIPADVARMVSSVFQPLPVGFQAIGWFSAISRVEP